MAKDTSLPDIVEHESWGSLAYMMQNFELELDMQNPKAKKVKKELEMVRKILHEELNRMEEYQTTPSAAFFVQISKTIERADKGLENNGVKNNAFLLFLKLILHKLKKQQLIVFKPEDRQQEFHKMKDLTEDEDDLIR